MWRDKNGKGWEGNLANDAGVGNVTLSYLQIFDPDGAVQIFDKLWDENKGTAHAKDESGPTYYRIHAGRALGTIRWDAWTDIPTSTVYKNAAGKTVVAVYNTSDKEQTCKLFENGKQTGSFQVPARRLVAWTQGDAKPFPKLATMLPTSKPEESTPAPSGAPMLSRIEVEPKIAVISDKSTQQFAAKGFDQFGKPFPISNVTWRVDGKGSVDNNGLYTPNGGGNHEQARFGVIASSNGIEGRGWAAVEESRRVQKITLIPNAPEVLKMATGSSSRFGAEAVDQFNARYIIPIKWSASGNVKVDDSGRITALAAGDGAVTAQAGDLKLTVPVKVLLLNQVNLAAFKNATASSSENDGSSAQNAADDNPKTRWSSAFSDPQWIAVDLEAVYALSKIVLTWENAAAKTYDIEVSEDGAKWTSVTKVLDGKPGARPFDLNGTKARYIRITGTQRTTGYGYSLYEIEAYGMP
jgi:hypothetical protein